MQFRVSVDRLTILGNEVKERFSTTLENNNFGFYDYSNLAKHPYKRNFHMVDGSVLQWTDVANMKALRYDFNPNKVETKDKEKTHKRAVVDILRTMKYPSYSRVDVAIDIFGVDLSDYQIIAGNQVKTNAWRSGTGVLETLYIGAPNSNHRIRIYDKAKEQKIVDGSHWWRIEVQLRDEAVIYPFIDEKKVFEGLVLHKSDLKQIEDVRVRAMLFYLRENPEEWGNLNRQTSSRYKKILAQLDGDENIKVDELFETKRTEVVAQLRNWLSYGELNNVIE